MDGAAEPTWMYLRRPVELFGITSSHDLITGGSETKALDQIAQNIHARLYLIQCHKFIDLMRLINTARAQHHGFHAQVLQKRRLSGVVNGHAGVSGEAFGFFN